MQVADDEKLREAKRRRKEEEEKEEEEKAAAIERSNFRRFRCHRFGSEEPDRPQDDSNLAPEGSSDVEVRIHTSARGWKKIR